MSPNPHRKVIAVDFDNTLFITEEYPKIKAPNWTVINAVKAEQAKGTAIILWTVRTGKDLEAAIEACESVGLFFDTVNDNHQERKAIWGNNPRKVSADEYWDDRAINVKDIINDSPSRCL